MESAVNYNENRRCVVVIPAYKKAFDEDEKKCVLKYCQVLKDETIMFIVPESLDLTWYIHTFPSISFRRFPDKFFKGINGYNNLMLNRDFYKSFDTFEYMLIAQPDACIWKEENMLDEFIDAGYDYYGAPWIPARRIWEWAYVNTEKGRKLVCCKKEGCGIEMGNGGFSLRRISKCIDLIDEFGWRKLYWNIKRNEDIFFGVLGRGSKKGFKLSDVETGKRFALEYHLKENVEKGLVPFGVHGWFKEFGSFDEMQDYLVEKNIWKTKI